MDVKEAVAIAKSYVSEMYADEAVTDLRLEETEYDESEGRWLITIGFSKPWDIPRTKIQDILENVGVFPVSRPAFKVIAVGENGTVLSMKNRRKAPAAG